MFRKEEEAVRQWSEDHVKMCAARQREILEDAASMLNQGEPWSILPVLLRRKKMKGPFLPF